MAAPDRQPTRPPAEALCLQYVPYRNIQILIEIVEKKLEMEVGNTYENIFSQEKNKQILVLGLDGAGKTSVLHTLASNRVQHSVAPPQGSREVDIDPGDNHMEFLEIGGSEPFHSHWEAYLSKGLLLIFVVDSADHNRLPEAKKYLHQLIKINPTLPLVVFAHKQDLKGAYHIADICDALALSEVVNGRTLYLCGTQVTKDSTVMPSLMQDAKDMIAYLAAIGLCPGLGPGGSPS
ncbi:ADP-ribosylation factor-like protein 9 [Ctenodactylus gundi]